MGVLWQELLRARVSWLAHVPAQGSNALASPVCCGPKTSAVQRGLTSGNLGFPQDCWFSILQAGSAWGAVKGRMASFPSMAVVLLDAHEISTSILPFLFPRSSLNRNFSFLGKLKSIWRQMRPLREPRLLQSKQSHFLASESTSYFFKHYQATFDGWKAWQRSEPHVHYEQRALFTSARVPNTVPGQAHNLLITDASRWKTHSKGFCNNHCHPTQFT